MIEAVVSAILVVMVAVGLLTAFEAAGRSTSEERNRARAHSIAQADLARMRTMRISALSNLNQTRTVTQDGTSYEVVSRGEFQTDATGTASCQAGTASADYIRISSTVRWRTIGSRPPVMSQSLVAPPNGSISPNTGSLAVGIEDSRNAGLPGVNLAGTGAGTFSGVTGANGCAIFGNLPAGAYTLSVTGSDLVDRNGNPPAPVSTSVVAEGTNTVVLQYDTPGSIPVTFTTNVGGNLVESSADSVVAFNSGMSLAKAFEAPDGPAAEVSATSLFPFTSPYTVYAGTCEGNNPNPDDDPDPPTAAAMASVLVPQGAGAPTTIQLPALHLTVQSGANPQSPGAPVSGARVRLGDTNCDADAGGPYMRTFTTNAAGQLPDPGLPYGSYDLCVDDGAKRVTVLDVPVEDLETGTTSNIYLGSGGAQTGTCP